MFDFRENYFKYKQYNRSNRDILKTDGRLNEKYPEGVQLQKKLLEEEGYTIIQKGTKNIKYYVKDFSKYLMELE